MIPINNKIDLKQFENRVVAYEGGKNATVVLHSLFSIAESPNVNFGVLRKFGIDGHGLTSFVNANDKELAVNLLTFAYLHVFPIKMKAASLKEISHLQNAVELEDARHDLDLNWGKLTQLAQQRFNQMLFIHARNDQETFISLLPPEIVSYITIGFFI